jgi:hypothetical protein
VFGRIRIGLGAIALLALLCAVGASAFSDPPTVLVTFRNATNKAMKVQFIGEGGVGYELQDVAAGATGSYTFTKNPQIVTISVSGCLRLSQLSTAKFYTRMFSKVATGIGSDCRLFAPVDTP